MSEKRKCHACLGSGIDAHANEPLPGQTAFAACPWCQGCGFEKTERTMREKKVVVPEGMLKAAMDAINGQEVPASACSIYDDSALAYGEKCGSVLRKVLEASLLWMSENPIVPTEKQFSDLIGFSIRKRSIGYAEEIQWHIGRLLVSEWQRRMFLAPDPEFPEEIRDLMPNLQEDIEVQKLYGFRIKEAYRRGKESK